MTKACVTLESIRNYVMGKRAGRMPAGSDNLPGYLSSVLTGTTKRERAEEIRRLLKRCKPRDGLCVVWDGDRVLSITVIRKRRR